MRTRTTVILINLTSLCSVGTQQLQAQWNTGVNGQQYLTNPTEGVTVGTGTGTPPSALTVDGNQMTPALGEVFRTDAPAGTTSWRLLSNTTQVGHLFKTSSANFHFNIDATNGNLQLRTNDVTRLRILPITAGAVINSYAGLTLTGNVGIGPFTGLTITQPFSLLHLDSQGQADAGFRPWMVTGTTNTRGSDLAYFGMKDEGGDRNHTVITWSDNTPGVDGPDRLKFIFNRNNVGGTIAASLDGLEAARFTPANSGNQVFMGVGDFFTPALDPTERLHLLNGRLRIQQLPTDLPDNTLTQVLVVDNVNPLSGEYGVVKWRDASTLGGGACDWEV